MHTGASDQQLTRLSSSLYLWTIYDHPLDAPDSYVARLFKVKHGELTATEHILKSPVLETIRSSMRDLGLVCLERSEDDDEHIVETWI